MMSVPGCCRSAESMVSPELETSIPSENSMMTLEVVDRLGRLVGEDPGLDPDLYQRMYRNMVLSRVLDRRMLALQRQGRIGTYAMLEGQEAVQIGSALALDTDDFVFPSYREHGVQVTRGLPIEVLLAYWKGLPNARWDMEKYRTGIVSVPIASQLPHAVGYSYVTKLRGQSTVTAVYFGDGATSEVDFHSGMNFAGVWKTPTVFICANNLYAISVPYEKQTASADHRPEGRCLRIRWGPSGRDGRSRGLSGDSTSRRQGTEWRWSESDRGDDLPRTAPMPPPTIPPSTDQGKRRSRGASETRSTDCAGSSRDVASGTTPWRRR